MVNNTSGILLCRVFVRLLIAFTEGGECIELVGYLGGDGKGNLDVEEFLDGQVVSVTARRNNFRL